MSTENNTSGFANGQQFAAEKQILHHANDDNQYRNHFKALWWEKHYSAR